MTAARLDRPIPYGITAAGNIAATTGDQLGVEQIIDGDTFTIQVDARSIARNVAAAILTEVRRDPQLLARLASHSGSTTPLHEEPVEGTIVRLAVAATSRGAHLIGLTPDEAADLAEALDEARVEPDRCLRDCDRYATNHGFCTYHDPEARVD